MTTTPTIDLLSLIEQRSPTRLKRVATTDGGEYAGNCPWCGGRDRFHVWPHSQKSKPHFWCRGCAKQGDAIQFLIEYEHMDFREALEELGLEPDDFSYVGTPSPLLLVSPKPCKEWQQSALEFIYQAQKYLFSSKGKEYREYLIGRGITLDTMHAKMIGVVPLREGKWIETTFERWGLTEDMLTSDQWAKGCVRVPDGLLFPYYGEDNKPWKLSMYRPLASASVNVFANMKRGLIMGSKECLLNEQLFTQDKPIIMTESFLDAISIEQEAGDLIIATSTDGTNSSRSLRCQAKLQYAPFVLQAFDGDQAGNDGANWWYQTIKNCIRHSPREVKDANEMLIEDPATVRRWIEKGIARAQQTTVSVPVIETTVEEIDTCFLCHDELHSYTDRGTPCCEKHYDARQAVELAMDAHVEQTIQAVSSVDPLTQFAQTVDKIADIFAPCTIHRDPPGYTLSDHVAFLNDKRRREEIAREIAQRRLQTDRRYAHLHSVTEDTDV